MQKILTTAAAIATAIALTGCTNTGNAVAEAPAALNDSIVTNLSRATVHAEPIHRELRLNGRIVPDEARQASVYALVSGRIEQVNVELGDYVHKGQTLAALRSVEVASVNNELALAKQNLEVARKNRDTYKELYDSNLAPEREYITANAEYEKALSELRKAQDVAAITGGENSLYTITSPVSGYIIAKNISSNTEVRADKTEPLFSVADLSVVWALADVFEVDIARIALGQTATVQTLSAPDRLYHGKIDRIYNVLDPETRTMKTRVSLDNKDNALKAGMFVSVKASVASADSAVAVPTEALVFDNNKLFVIVADADGKPQIRPVSEIYRSGDKCYVEGINDGETVFTAGQLFLFEALMCR